MTGNERRYLTRVERRANRAWSLYVTGWMCLTGAAAFLVVAVLVWGATWAMIKGAM